MAHSFGLYNDKFKMASVAIESRQTITVRGKLKDVTVQCGPLLLSGKTYEKTFLLTVNYRQVEDAHSQSLGAYSFGSHLCYDYAEAVTNMVYEWCEKNGFLINDEINHWPVLQFVLTFVGNRVDDEDLICELEQKYSIFWWSPETDAVGNGETGFAEMEAASIAHQKNTESLREAPLGFLGIVHWIQPQGSANRLTTYRELLDKEKVHPDRRIQEVRRRLAQLFLLNGNTPDQIMPKVDNVISQTISARAGQELSC